MKLKLKESPREWLKFTAVMGVALGVVGLLGRGAGWLGGPAWAPFVPGAAAVLLCWARPTWFRGFYRGGMTASFHMGQFMGRVLLTLFFLVLLTPMGLILRAFGKDLLHLKKAAHADTYWRPARPPGPFDQQF